jgi:tetratricopeptide (TPR) repeat protein
MVRPLLTPALLSTLLFAGSAVASISPEALALRDRGLAELENEKPAEAGETFRKLVKVAPESPLGWANLAVASLRQQKHTEAVAFADRALEKAPRRADLLHLKADVLQWSGRPELALPVYRQAAEQDPHDPEILYSLYRQATTLADATVSEHARWALDRLAGLRPDNVVLMLQRGQRAIEAGDRAQATEALLRVEELLWQAPPLAERAMQMVLEALESGDLSTARVPAVRLENVLKVTPMYQQGLRELSSGIQGVPVERFAGEERPRAFGTPKPVTWERSTVATGRGLAVVAADFDGDEKTDLAWLLDGKERRVEILRAAAAWKPSAAVPAPGVERLLAVDLDNDGSWDLVGVGPNGARAWKGDGKGGLVDVTAAWGLEAARGLTLTIFDFDIEGDLDLVLGGGTAPRLQLWRNSLEGPLQEVASQAFPEAVLRSGGPVTDLVASDVDRDGDLDLLVAHGGVTWLDNLRQGELAERTASIGLDGLQGVARASTGDFDQDGALDLVTAGEAVELRPWQGGRYAPPTFRASLPAPARTVIPFDLDNDGRLDLAVGTADGWSVYGQGTDGRLAARPVAEATGLTLHDGLATDLDGDGDLDLVAATDEGLLRWENRGGNENHWLAVRLRGLDKGNSKNNVFGLGSVVEVRNGAAYQLHEARHGVVHLGLGDQRAADVLRVVWTNGVPQNRLAVKGDQWIVEEQVLKGSCPFLYAWNGHEIAFVTDLLWGAPIGLPVAPGVWAGADPSEIVVVEGARSTAVGRYDLRITEELWEAAFFDHVRLWVVDHPADVEVASNLHILPGTRLPEEVRGSRDLRPVVEARDGEGRLVTDRVARRDDVYASGYRESRYQGLADEPWTFTFGLGERRSGPVRLHLDGWIFPADASLNLAMAQRSDVPPFATRLEVEVDGGWVPLLDPMGFPAGKTKTMVVDLPPLPEGASRLRIVSRQWLAWDRIAWTSQPADDEAVVVATLRPESADLEYRGFSRLVRRAPNAPHDYDYQRVSATSPWLPFPGRYTRYGDVRELLAAADDRSVILAAGDEMRLLFDASGLPAPAPGQVRTVFLESHGWDKDADRNTYQARSVEPLPFRAMTGYPGEEGESFPSTPELDAYRQEWLTREIRDVGTSGLRDIESSDGGPREAAPGTRAERSKTESPRTVDNGGVGGGRR